MEQNQETSPQPRPLEMDPVLDSTPAVPAIEQDPKMLPLQPGPGAIPSIKPTTKPKAPATRANWVNTLWADVSGQLRRFSVISSDLFDGLLLKKNTYVGSLICTEMRMKYEQLGEDRNLASVRVLTPETAMGEMWQLVWTIKRHRDPNVRQFHSRSTIGPIENQAHLAVETNHSVTFFPLPPFIQDYGPGPSEFDPQPGDGFQDFQLDDFDTVVQGNNELD